MVRPLSLRATGLLALVALSLATATAPADEITFRPDPFGNPGVTFPITGFDPGPGSLLVLNQIPVLQGGGGDVNVVFQSQLSNILPNAAVPGLGTSFQILTLANFRVKLVPLSATDLFVTNPTTPGPNLVELRYHDLSVPINEKTGAGYNTVGDPVILRGRVVEVDGAGLLDPMTPPVDLDQSITGPDGTPTLTTDGDQLVRVAIDFMNPLFFPDPSKLLTELLISTRTSTPFTQVTPNMGGFFNGNIRNLGNVNVADGPDVLFESDPNATLRAVNIDVPEPASLALLLLGLGGLGVARAARRSTAR